MKILAKTATLALAAIGFAGTAVSPALANPDRVHRTVSVSYADIDLGTAQGQKQLDRRSEKAVHDVCRSTDINTGTRVMSSDAMNCLAKARADAKRQVAAIVTRGQRGG